MMSLSPNRMSYLTLRLTAMPNRAAALLQHSDAFIVPVGGDLKRFKIIAECDVVTT